MLAPHTSAVMPMLTGRTAPSSGESSLDARLCGDLGAELARVRESRGLSVAMVGQELLLSTRQVKALESVDFGAFHNATFYLGALRKYAAFAGVDPARVSAIAAGLVKPDLQAIMLVPSESSDEANEPSSSQVLSIVGTLLAVAVLAGGAFYLASARQTGTAASVPAASQPVPAAAPTPAALPAPAPAVVSEPTVVPAVETPAAALPAATSTVPPDTGSFGSLRVLHPTWIFVRDAENAVTERSLAVGDTFTFDSQPTYLAVGTADAELTIGTRKVDITKFVANGQVRIRAGDFDALVHDVTPIQAPTPARP